MDKERIKAELDACLLKLPASGDIDAKAWARLDDPFPVWHRNAA
jgi:hypothetical protein